MIKLSKLNLDKKLMSEIASIGNSCGVMSCYILSEIFNFYFNIEEFRNIGEGMTAKQVQDYAARNGVSYISKESVGITGNSNATFADYNMLLKNNIVADISGKFNYSDSESVFHTVIASDISNNKFTPIYNQNGGTELNFNQIANSYITFFYKDVEDINKFVEFTK